jgi:hypothetical protein
MVIRFRDTIITAGSTYDTGVMDVEIHESLERLKHHAVSLIRYMGKCTEDLQKMWQPFEMEKEGIVIPTHVRWLANLRPIRQRRQNGEIAVSSVVLVVKGSKLTQRIMKKGIKVGEVRDRVATYTNKGHDSWWVQQGAATAAARQSR